MAVELQCTRWTLLVNQLLSIQCKWPTEAPTTINQLLIIFMELFEARRGPQKWTEQDLQAGCTSCRPAIGVKALEATRKVGSRKGHWCGISPFCPHIWTVHDVSPPSWRSSRLLRFFSFLLPAVWLTDPSLLDGVWCEEVGIWPN